MDQIDSITAENNVFNRQQSIYGDSTAYLNNSEALVVVWLRATPATAYINFDLLESKIENSADLLKLFDDQPEKCEEYIRTTHKNLKIFFIVSMKYAHDLLENTRDLHVIQSIYIYDEISKEEEFKNYSKVVNVYTDLNLLTDELCSMIYRYSLSVQLPITIFKERYEQDQTTTLLNNFAYFVNFWNPLFIDLLFDLSQTDYEQQKAKFIEQCRINYRANKSVLKVIDEFENTYKPEFSILWYKRDSFVCRLMNKVMRQQNIEGILLIRFFILDLFKQLNQIYHEFIDSNVYEDNSYYNIYRGQMMFSNELDRLKMNLTHGTIISINSFFSATRTEDVALRFAGIIDTDHATTVLHQNKKHVLFEIKIEINHKFLLKRKPFADEVIYQTDID